MKHRTLALLSILAVALGAGVGDDAYAERLGANYRGPKDAKSAETGAQEDEGTDTSTEPDSTGPESGGTDDGDGGLSGEGGGDGDGDGDGDGEATPPPESSGPSEGDLGSGDSGATGESAGTTDDGSGGLSVGGATGGGPRGAGSGNAQEPFQYVSWYFEHNRERFVYEVNEKRNRRVRLPYYSAVNALGKLPRDSRKRALVTTQDRERIFDILKEAAADPSAVVRDTAAIALGKLGGPKAVELLKERLAAETATDVKQDLLIALGLTRSPDAIAPLVAALEEKALVSFALVGLGLSQDREKAAPAVLEYFEGNVRQAKKHVDALCSATLALGSLRFEEAVGPLEKAARNRSHPRVVRVYAAHALGNIGGEKAQKALLKAFADKDQQIARAAALALGSFDDASILKSLAGKDGLRSPDPLGAGYAALSMGSILSRVPEAEWKSFPDALREMAVATNKNKIKSQYGNLALALFDGFDNDVRRFYSEEIAGTALDPDTKSALVMAAGVGQLTSESSSIGEIARSASGDPKLGSYAAMSLGMLSGADPGKTAAELRNIYGRVTRDDVRRGTVLALGLVGDRKDVSFLLDVIKKTEESWLGGYTRGAAAMALGLIRDGESVGRIQKLTADPDARTRAYGIAALGYLGDKDAVPVLPSVFANNNFRIEFDTLKVLMAHL